MTATTTASNQPPNAGEDDRIPGITAACQVGRRDQHIGCVGER